MNEKIFIAEDEAEIRLTVKTFLESEGYEVREFDTGDALYEAFSQEEPDLIILDVMMPGSSGFEITRKIRTASTVPIIILTAKDSDLDYATGINLGSDDYFTKPFSAIALTMRVKAILRRIQMDQEQTQPASGVTGAGAASLSIGDVVIDTNTKTVNCGRTNLNFTPNEYSLFHYLLENRERAVSRDEILEKIWGYSEEVETRACDDTVRRLRKKLAPTKVKIETVWGFGFIVKEQDK